eukprot:Tamp_16051.p2 GENE.Tamp_16051~~Tamp_16051.p2  ORF type:complete len:185 (+),score=48.63 Tamp_16051:936-1490(+)
MSTKQKLEREQRIKLMKALHGPPHMGKSLVPKTPSADVTINLVKQTGFEDRFPVVQMDARPAEIRAGKQDRALLKLARKKIHHRVLELATPKYLPLEAPASAGTAHIMNRMWHEYIDYTRKKGVERSDGRLSQKDFGELVKKLGMDNLTNKNVQSIFKMADKDGSGAVDWSEFANLLVINVSKE